MMKDWIKNMRKKLDERTSPDAPILTQDAVERFILRVLLMVLVYAITTTFIIKGVQVWQFVVVDGMIYAGESILKLKKKK
jgi:hypothetical protein